MIRTLLAVAFTAAVATPALAADAWSPDAEYQLGTKYASSGHPGLAILALERAHLLAPRDAAIGSELVRTREAAGIAEPEQSRLDAALGTLTSDEWALLALAGGVVASLGTIGLAWSVRRRAAITTGLVGAAIAGLALTAAIAVAPREREAIVVRSEPARIAPLAAAEPAFTAPEGETVEVEQTHGDYIYVRDGDRAGWLPRDSVERVVATRSELPHA
ncbi:MAG TPA: hypothetical protein VGG28_23640 [Kofleriaceae bacterium]|jgi:hypothetical protein